MKHSEITAVVLAGGHSSRLGMDKAQLKLDGAQTLLENVVSRMRRLSTDVVVVADVMAEVAGVRYVGDTVLGGGPLGGLYSGILAARFSHCLVVACDMPFLNLRLLHYMAERPRDYDVLMPRLGEKSFGCEVHPLHAIYSKDCLSDIKGMLAVGPWALRDICSKVKTVYLEREAIARFDPDGLSFFNVNTPEDVARAKALLKARPWLAIDDAMI